MRATHSRDVSSVDAFWQMVQTIRQSADQVVRQARVVGPDGYFEIAEWALLFEGQAFEQLERIVAFERTRRKAV